MSTDTLAAYRPRRAIPRGISVSRSLADEPVLEGLANRPADGDALAVNPSDLRLYQSRADECAEILRKGYAALAFFKAVPPPNPAWLHWVEDRLNAARFDQTRAQQAIEQIMEAAGHA